MEKKERTQIHAMKNEKGGITTDHVEIQKINIYLKIFIHEDWKTTPGQIPRNI